MVEVDGVKLNVSLAVYSKVKPILLTPFPCFVTWLIIFFLIIDCCFLYYMYAFMFNVVFVENLLTVQEDKHSSKSLNWLQLIKAFISSSCRTILSTSTFGMVNTIITSSKV